jgi:hypothetical protein
MFESIKAACNAVIIAAITLTYRWNEHDTGDAPVFAELYREIEENKHV